MNARVLFLSGLVSMLVACASGKPAVTATPEAGALKRALPTLFVAGDSTAAPKSDSPQQGWGVPFADYFDLRRINIANRALGGRSSRTFITEGHWERLLAEVKPGDYVLIQFGHNDGGGINEEPPGSTLPLRARGSIPGLGEQTQAIDNVVTKQHEIVHTFGWYIRKMMAEARDKGATPIVMSLTVRNYWNDGRVELGSGNYRQWDRELAWTAEVDFIDVTALIAERYEKLGEAQVGAYFLPDRIHTTVAGADFNAKAVVAGLRNLPKRPFEKYLTPKGRAVR
jgi:lysophospholipase L1-like esterase